jgi:uncharacterized protein (UPF0335 family)
MASFHQQLQKSTAIQPEKLSNELFQFIKSLSAYMVEMNKKQINEDSKDIYGKAIGFYSKATEIITNGAKGAGEPFTGKDTGNWLNSFYVTVQDNTFYFGSTDPKTDDILDSPHWLSSSLFGLTDENLNLLIESRLKPFVLDYYRQKLDL